MIAIHSPEHILNDTTLTTNQLSVFLKRDDVIHPFISGNKWRKLKYNIEMARSERKSTLVTFGGSWSNHLLATACAGAIEGFKTIGFVRGDNVQNPVLDMCRLFGMTLQFVSRSEYKKKDALFQKLENSSDCYFIDEGGSGIEAVKGCEEIIHELNNKYDYIICPAGTGTTLAGLAKGIASLKLKTKLIGVPVLKGGEFIYDEMKNLDAPIPQTELLTDYHFGGYAKTNDTLNEFVKTFMSDTGIMIEPTYSGKAMYALYDLIQKNYFPHGSKILFLHTGGLTGLLGQLNKFNFK